MEKFHAFENWLKASGYTTGGNYLGYMHTIDETLSVKEFEKITSKSILQQLMIQLQNNRSFAARGKSDRDNILSGFRTYIIFITETNQKKK